MPQLLRERISNRAQALWLGGFSLYFLLLRVPELLANWDGEDANGHCAAILLGWAAPNELIFSRIDGVSQFHVGFTHPIAPYLLLSLVGKLVRAIVPLDALHGQTLIFALKAIVSLLQLSVFLALLLLAFRYARNRLPIAWVWVLAATPVALYGSNEIQPDSSTGFFLIALFFIATLLAQAPDTGRVAGMLWLLAGGFAAGLGKNEWTFCLAAALVVTALAHPLLRPVVSRRSEIEPKDPGSAAIPVILAVSLGLTAGNLASYLLDPSDYVGGWQLLRSLIVRASILSGDTGTWWALFLAKFPYIFFHFVVDASILIQLMRRPQMYSAALLLAAAFANTLFFSYVISSWGSFPRYFAPAFIGFGTCFLIILQRLPLRDGRSWTVIATIIVVALQSLDYQVTEHYWRLWRGYNDKLARISKFENDPARCVLVLDYSFVLDRPNVDFVHAPFGRDTVDRYLASIGRPACPW
jgi:hypothetical protein